MHAQDASACSSPERPRCTAAHDQCGCVHARVDPLDRTRPEPYRGSDPERILLANIIHKAIPAFAALMATELAAAALAGRDAYDRDDTRTSLAMGVVNVAGEALTKGLTRRAYQWCYDRRVVDPPTSGLARKAALVVLDDLVYYWFHRLHHEVRVLWSAHVNHHSSERYNLSTALRQSWLTPLTKLPFYAPLGFLGFTPEEIEHAHHANLLYQFWVHTELIDRLGPLEEVMSTPSHHRVHHGSNLRYLDRNYGGIFIVWDRLFGTFVREDRAERVRFGILHDIGTTDLWVAEMHEFLAMLRDVDGAASWHEALMRVLGPPGWSADGSSRTVEEMRASPRPV